MSLVKTPFFTEKAHGDARVLPSLVATKSIVIPMRSDTKLNDRKVCEDKCRDSWASLEEIGWFVRPASSTQKMETSKPTNNPLDPVTTTIVVKNSTEQLDKSLENTKSEYAILASPSKQCMYRQADTQVVEMLNRYIGWPIN